MIAIELRFLAGRFHATPWGRHVNEGVPEWPPSPFRLLRALYDCWRRKCSDIDRERVEPLLRVLAAEPPVYRLPRAGASHTRAFLRQGSTDVTEKRLVFDPFVVIMPSDPVVIGWPRLQLPHASQEMLSLLLSRLGYLGRAESLVEAMWVDAPDTSQWNCIPTESSAPHKGDAQWEVLRVACVAAPDQHMHLETRRGKRAETQSLGWFDALTWGTREVLDHKLSDPPALRWVSYKRRAGALELPALAAPAARPQPVHAILFALHSRVLPLVADTLVVAEQFRVRALGAHKRLFGEDRATLSQRLSGKGAAGLPLKEDHRHAYFLPLDRDGDGRIDHVLVRCDAGLEDQEQQALERVTKLWQPRGKPDVKIIQTASGDPDTVLERGTRWTSITPFVSLRHYKPRLGPPDAWMEGELRRALAQHRLPSPVSIEREPVLKLGKAGRTQRWIAFRRHRKDDPVRPGSGFTITFAEPVHGPFAVGYGAHFGLGAFRLAP